MRGGLAACTSRIDPERHIRLVRVAGTAGVVKRVLDLPRADMPVGGTGQRMVLLSPAGSIDALEPEAVSGPGVGNAENDHHALRIRRIAGDVRSRA